jgi:hypothetical protein
MFRKIGTGDSGEPLVLAELNPDEKRALGDILFAADHVYRKVRGRQNAITITMVDELRRAFGIPDDCLVQLTKTADVTEEN